jgi:hypothetical protein
MRRLVRIRPLLIALKWATGDAFIGGGATETAKKNMRYIPSGLKHGRLATCRAKPPPLLTDSNFCMRTPSYASAALNSNLCQTLNGAWHQRLVICPSSYHHLFMSWHFSQALVEAYLGEKPLDGEPFAPSNGTPTHGIFWSPDKTTDVSKPSRSGMTFKPSTERLGAELLTWCLEASHAKTSQPPAKVQESKVSEAVCGSTWRESSAKYCLSSSSWKTHQCLWEEDLEWSSLTLPKWGMMRDGVLWERTTPELHTNGIESGLWVTPCATDAKPITGGNLYQTKTGTVRHMRPDGKSSNRGLEAQVMWPTPDAHMGSGGRTSARPPTGKRPSGTKQQITINDAVKWATPQARDFRTGQQSRWENPERTRNLNDQIGGQLNPTWVEWLMGWPLGWTDCAVSATDKFRQWCHSHGISYSKRNDDEPDDETAASSGI